MTTASPLSMEVGKPTKHQRAKTPVTTTARKNKKKKGASGGVENVAANAKGTRLKVGDRVTIKRCDFKSKIDVDSQNWDVIKSHPDQRKFKGTAMQSIGRKRWSVKLDELHAGEDGKSNIIDVQRNHIHLLKGKDEPAFDHRMRNIEQIVMECEQNRTCIDGTPDDSDSEDDGGDEEGGTPSRKKKGKRNHAKESIDNFLKMTAAEMRRAKTFEYAYGAGEDDTVKWTILGDGEQIINDPMDQARPTRLPDESDEDFNKRRDDWRKRDNPYKKDIEWTPNAKDMEWWKIFFDHFFPSLKGKAYVMDLYLNNPRCSMYQTIKHDKIKFNREDEEDPDRIVSNVVHFHCQQNVFNVVHI